jgi:hypothetical protein
MAWTSDWQACHAYHRNRRSAMCMNWQRINIIHSDALSNPTSEWSHAPSRQVIGGVANMECNGATKMQAFDSCSAAKSLSLADSMIGYSILIGKLPYHNFRWRFDYVPSSHSAHYSVPGYHLLYYIECLNILWDILPSGHTHEECNARICSGCRRVLDRAYRQDFTLSRLVEWREILMLASVRPTSGSGR